ncbi:MAG: RagB/SusD family nutrient uptake outer membrane protein [Bacteroidales bacterium]
MKSIKRYIAIGMAVCALASCQDFLKEENKSNIASEDYFRTVEGYESLVTGSYATLRSVWGDSPWLFCLGVDIYTRGNSELRDNSYQNRDIYSSDLNEYTTLGSDNGFVSDFYADCYDAIQTCNTAIARAEDVDGLTEKLKQKRLAEVRFIRAYYYYLLVEQFGDIPLVVDEINSAITHFDRVSEQDIYRFVISELTGISATLPMAVEEFGRVTSGAAKNLLSLIYLTRAYKSYAASDDFSQAATLADEVIHSDSYGLLDTFEEVFTPGNENSKEIIFSVQYDASSLGSAYGGNTQSVIMGWDLVLYENGFDAGSTIYNKHNSQFMPSQYLYSLFDTDLDTRYDGTFKSEFYAVIDSETQGIKAGDLKVYFPKWDKPMTDAEKTTFLTKHPVCNIVEYDMWKQDFNNIGGANRFPMVWKFFDPEALKQGSLDNGTGTRDIFLFRLAETYLIAAEAYLQQGETAIAAKRINKVRERAAIEGKKTDMKIAPSDVTIDFILDERARELVGEYKRWMDLKRTGKLIERTLANNNLAKAANGIKEIHLLRPIPQSVIDRDTGEFPQNTGYN